MLCIKAIYIAAFAVWEQAFKLPFKASLFNKKIQFWHSTLEDRTYSIVVTWVAFVSERIKSQHTVKEAKLLPNKTQLLMQLNPLCFKCCWRKMIIRVIEPKANIVKHVAKKPSQGFHIVSLKVENRKFWKKDFGSWKTDAFWHFVSSLDTKY